MYSFMINILILVAIQFATGDKTFLVKTYDDNNTSLNKPNGNNPMETNLQRKKKITQPIIKHQTFSAGDYSYSKQSAKSNLNFNDSK